MATGKGEQQRPRRRRRTTYNRPEGVRHLLAGYDLPTEKLYSHVKIRKGRTEFLAFCRYLRSLHPAEVQIRVLCGNFSPHLSTKTDGRVGEWAAVKNVELATCPSTALLGSRGRRNTSWDGVVWMGATGHVPLPKKVRRRFWRLIAAGSSTKAAADDLGRAQWPLPVLRRA